MTFVPKPRAEKIMATSGDISDFPSSCGTSGYSGGEPVEDHGDSNCHFIVCNRASFSILPSNCFSTLQPQRNILRVCWFHIIRGNSPSPTFTGLDVRYQYNSISSPLPCCISLQFPLPLLWRLQLPLTIFMSMLSLPSLVRLCFFLFLLCFCTLPRL